MPSRRPCARSTPRSARTLATRLPPAQPRAAIAARPRWPRVVAATGRVYDRMRGPVDLPLVDGFLEAPHRGPLPDRALGRAPDARAVDGAGRRDRAAPAAPPSSPSATPPPPPPAARPARRSARGLAAARADCGLACPPDEELSATR